MSEKLYLLILILCGILCGGINATLSDEDTKASSNFHIRKKRVITHIPSGINPIFVEDAKYMLTIKKNYGAHCAGAILSHYTAITAASCITLELSNYQVLSGARYENYGIIHSITTKDVYQGHSPHQYHDGIALLTVDPPFQYNRRTGQINLYVGPLRPGTQVTVNGWGVSYRARPAPAGMRRALRSISLPIMNHAECQNDCRGEFNVTNKHVCTYCEQQYCAPTDIGAPLIVNQMLAGIHIWKGEYSFRKNPDVFIDLQRDDYSAWIRNNTLLM